MLVYMRKRERMPFCLFALLACLSATDHSIYTYIFFKEGRQEGREKKKEGREEEEEEKEA